MSLGFANFRQHDPRRTGEIGVQAEHFDGERYLVNDALAGGMSLGPKLQVFRSVIGTCSVDVMDVFIGAERATNNAGHDLPMFVDGFSFPVDGNRTNYPSVSVLAKVSPGFSVQEALSGFTTLVCDRARLRAKALIANVCAGMRLPAGLVDVKIAPHWSDGTAFFAGEHGNRGVSFGGCLAPAFAGAVHRITAPLLAVIPNAPGKVGKCHSAMLACKRNHFWHSALRMGGVCIMSWSGGLRNLLAMPQVFVMENK